jgi:hypothetical protein
MFTICPNCKVSRKVFERIDNDRKTGKNWLITYCEKCHFNFDLEASKGETTPSKEIAKPEINPWERGHFKRPWI